MTTLVTWAPRTSKSLFSSIPSKRGRVRDFNLRTLSSSPPPSSSSDSPAGDGKPKEQEQRRVKVETDSNGICHVILNRPNKLNAVDLEMFETLGETAMKLRNDKAIRVILLRGEGRAFCTGLDVKAVLNGPQKQMKRLLERPSGYGTKGMSENDNEHNNGIGNLAQDVSYLWRQVPVPVIAVLHGMCFGAGVQIALGADFRYATKTCQLSIMESKWGIIPDMSGSIALRELVRIDIAKELTMTGRIIQGEEAYRLGLVTRVFDNDDDTLQQAKELANTLVQKSPDVLASTKQLYQSTWIGTSEKECLEIETNLQRKLLASWNQLAASGRAFGWPIPYWNRKN